ncbi:MAG: GtrA family protein [Rikenellaceae bacterium]
MEILYIPPFKAIFTPQTFRYIACGAGNYLVLDAIIYFVCYHYIIQQHYIDIGFMVISPHVASLCIVFPLTFASGFWLNRHVAFRVGEEAVGGQLLRYAISVGGSIIISYIALKFLVEGVHIWATPSKVICSIITSIYSYLAARYFTFRKKGQSRDSVQTENKQKDL